MQTYHLIYPVNDLISLKIGVCCCTKTHTNQKIKIKINGPTIDCFYSLQLLLKLSQGIASLSLTQD